jgi:hypothetical protein
MAPTALGGKAVEESKVVTPVVPNQFQVGKNKIVHKPTNAAFNFDVGSTMFRSIDWGRAGEQLPSGHYRRDDVTRVAQQLLTKLPK